MVPRLVAIGVGAAEFQPLSLRCATGDSVVHAASRDTVSTNAPTSGVILANRIP